MLLFIQNRFGPEVSTIFDVSIFWGPEVSTNFDLFIVRYVSMFPDGKIKAFIF